MLEAKSILLKLYRKEDSKWRTIKTNPIMIGLNNISPTVKMLESQKLSFICSSTYRNKRMNMIIKKLCIPGHETKVIIKPKENETKQVDGVQLSLDIDTGPKNLDKVE